MSTSAQGREAARSSCPLGTVTSRDASRCSPEAPLPPGDASPPLLQPQATTPSGPGEIAQIAHHDFSSQSYTFPGTPSSAGVASGDPAGESPFSWDSQLSYLGLEQLLPPPRPPSSNPADYHRQLCGRNPHPFLAPSVSIGAPPLQQPIPSSSPSPIPNGLHCADISSEIVTWTPPPPPPTLVGHQFPMADTSSESVAAALPLCPDGEDPSTAPLMEFRAAAPPSPPTGDGSGGFFLNPDANASSPAGDGDFFQNPDANASSPAGDGDFFLNPDASASPPVEPFLRLPDIPNGAPNAPGETLFSFNDSSHAWMNNRAYKNLGFLGKGGFGTVYKLELLTPAGFTVKCDEAGFPKFEGTKTVLERKTNYSGPAASVVADPAAHGHKLNRSGFRFAMKHIVPASDDRGDWDDCLKEVKLMQALKKV